jgi:micrococcal nuclease
MALAPPPFNWPILRVIRIKDGDTLVVEVDRGFRTRTDMDVRLLGLDAPEVKTAAGALVLKVAERWLQPAAGLQLHSHELDGFGRVLGHVVRAGDSLTDFLIFRGLAVAYKRGTPRVWLRHQLEEVEARATEALADPSW